MSQSTRQDVIIAALLGGIAGGLTVATVLNFVPRRRPITRLECSDPRMSGIVIRDGVVTISGQVGDVSKCDSTDVTTQTKETLAKVHSWGHVANVPVPMEMNRLSGYLRWRVHPSRTSSRRAFG